MKKSEFYIFLGKDEYEDNPIVEKVSGYVNSLINLGVHRSPSFWTVTDLKSGARVKSGFDYKKDACNYVNNMPMDDMKKLFDARMSDRYLDIVSKFNELVNEEKNNES